MNFKVEYNVDLKTHNTYGIGGIAKYVFHPRDNQELISILKHLNTNQIKWYILGSGSNVILPDENFEGAIIRLDEIDEFQVNDDYIYVSSGLLLSTVINRMFDDGFVNLAPLMGIPGTLGGAIMGNAGSFGTDVFSHLVDVTFLNDNYEIIKIPAENIKHGYRYSEFKEYKIIILGATIKGVRGNVNEAKKIVKENVTKRVTTQPLDKKNAGSVFKNPEGLSAGALIDECGLKGYEINGAKVSEKHANFIINNGSATAADIIKLIEFVQEVVYNKKNIRLELEQVIIKW